MKVLKAIVGGILFLGLGFLVAEICLTILKAI